MNVDHETCEITLALMWVHKKRAFAVSRDFQGRISDLMDACITQTQQLDLFGNSTTEWVFLGVKAARELGIPGDSPEKFVVLWSHGV